MNIYHEFDQSFDPPDQFDVEVERELIREANQRHAEQRMDKLVSFGLIVLMTLALLVPKALRWFYFLWK